jgi:uncharacterized protein YjdB
MKQLLSILILAHFSLIQYGQVIADHTVVDKFSQIPQQYIDSIKKMWLVVAGESHSQAYRDGLTALGNAYPKFAVNVTESGTPEAYTASHLRVSRGTWGDYSNSSGWIYTYGEEDWWTNATALSRTKAGIAYCNTHNLVIGAIGFGWCWDAVGGYATSVADPVYGVHWNGWSEGSPDGERPWGLDAGDYDITHNTVNMDTYISATQGYIDYCNANGYATKVFFTTGTIDNYDGWGEGEVGYQGYLKWEHLRAYVETHPSSFLFDYADILCWNNDGTQTTTTWNDNTYPTGTTANTGTEETGHITNTGALRLAKAMWWMLARMAGWNGGEPGIPVTGITVTGAGGESTIATNGGTLQLSATILPSDATNKTITWSITNNTGHASISSSGLVTAITNGTVTAKATANDGSGVSGSLLITISNQDILVTGITVTGEGGISTITANAGTLQLNASVLPINATDKTVTWSLTNGTGQASINASGLVTAFANGIVTAKATANDASGVYGILEILISVETLTDFSSGNNGFQVFQSSDKIIIESTNQISNQYNCFIYSVSGSLIRYEKPEKFPAEFDLSTFKSGFYILVIADRLKVTPYKLIIH